MEVGDRRQGSRAFGWRFTLEDGRRWQVWHEPGPAVRGRSSFWLPCGHLLAVVVPSGGKASHAGQDGRLQTCKRSHSSARDDQSPAWEQGCCSPGLAASQAIGPGQSRIAWLGRQVLAVQLAWRIRETNKTDAITPVRMPCVDGDGDIKAPGCGRGPPPNPLDAGTCISSADKCQLAPGWHCMHACKSTSAVLSLQRRRLALQPRNMRDSGGPSSGFRLLPRARPISVETAD